MGCDCMQMLAHLPFAFSSKIAYGFQKPNRVWFLNSVNERQWMGRDSNSRPPACKAVTDEIAAKLQNYNRPAFQTWLQTVREQEERTAHDNAIFVGTFVKSGKTPADFVKSYTKPNSYNNALKAVNHYCDFLNVPRPGLKPKPRTVANLIIAPKPEDVKEIIQKLRSLDAKTYMALCATTGIRCEKVHHLKWSQIDFENGWVNINERHGKKVYRPNPLHKDVAQMLTQLREKAANSQERVFTFGYK